MVNFDATRLDALQSAIVGIVSTPGESAYETAVDIWNAAITRRPAIVASCTSSSDVSAAIAFACHDEFEISVRGGGHNYAGFALTEGGMMIDLTPMKSVAVATSSTSRPPRRHRMTTRPSAPGLGPTGPTCRFMPSASAVT